MFVLPGTYKVYMALYEKGVYKKLTEPVDFKVKKLNNTTLPAEDKKAMLAYLKDLNETVRVVHGTINYTEELKKKLIIIKQTIVADNNATVELMTKVLKAEKEINEVLYKLEGLSSKASYEEIPPHKLPISVRLMNLAWTHSASTSAITQTEKDQLKIVKEQLPEVISKLKQLGETVVPEIEKELDKIKAPWTPGRLIDID